MQSKEYVIQELNLDVLDGDRGKNYPHQNELANDGYCLFLSANNVTKEGFRFDDNVFISKEKDEILRGGKLQRNDIVITTRGTVGNLAYYDYSVPYDKIRINSGMLIVRCGSGLNSRYIYYALSSREFGEQIKAMQTGSAQPQLPKSHFNRMRLRVPSLETQNKIAKLLYTLDEKIIANRKVNHNLQQQVLALYRQMFVDSPNDNRKICRADEYFDISIGKTPPRKEPEWFKTIRTDNIVWVSIADMGNCGLFIGDSSEYLSPDAVKKFNVVTVPNNTVLLSFKLTVGRIAITDGQMTTNEAIAHFKTDNKAINEYLYCYLKSYNFQTLGSTSSIATAVNSKIIKAMPFVVPTDEELSVFHDFAAPAFGKIKACQHENMRLAELRDSLLPKLMSGEINVSEVEI